MSCYQSQCWVLGVCQCCAWSVNSFSRLAVFTLANGATTFYRGGSSESCKTIDISSVGVTEPRHFAVFAHRGPPRPPDDDYPPPFIPRIVSGSAESAPAVQCPAPGGCRLQTGGCPRLAAAQRNQTFSSVAAHQSTPYGISYIMLEISLI